jgi:hypothetical protein
MLHMWLHKYVTEKFDHFPFCFCPYSPYRDPLPLSLPFIFFSLRLFFLFTRDPPSLFSSFPFASLLGSQTTLSLSPIYPCSLATSALSLSLIRTTAPKHHRPSARSAPPSRALAPCRLHHTSPKSVTHLSSAQLCASG